MCSIRCLTQDYVEWHNLWNGYLKFYNTEVSEEMYQLAFNRMLSNEENEFHGIVAVREGKLIGIAHYLFHRHGWKSEKVCYLQDLFVSP